MNLLNAMLITALLAVSTVSHAEKSNTEQLGDAGQIVLPLTALAVSIGDGQYDDTGQFLLRFGTAISTMLITKRVVNEERPNGGDYSFPSGHTTSAFSGAAFLHSEYGWKWGVPAYAAASFVGWSRIDANKHWPHDVYAGAALAIGVNYLFAAYAKPSLNLNLDVTTDTIVGGIDIPW